MILTGRILPIYSGLVELIGIIVGHLYYFIQYQYPEQYDGQVLLKTPQILYDYLPSSTASQPGATTGSSAGFQYFAPGGDRSGRGGQDSSSSTTSRRSWGRGYVLGSS